MNSNVLTQTIVTGSDPRGLPEFSAIREEINKASHPSQPELNWKLVESLALAIFKANGVDLHTATYYTLARTRTQGLAGFCEGAESLLTQYQDARAQKQNTDALEKQINERLEGVLSRWLLLKNNVMAEAATGTTTGK